ncbi:MAG: hypothetical protein RMJ19_02015 [Gemmatales bacterium]|nr:hypothetical protein [Gemmatales bacterium]MCS7159222.1 hypothetical protein [Gemmatales bacterium]MDW8174422.1 hypothetical protein [Gemmatales bacterium]MDW8222271.1 hypothetical protein [Gemmatales bacterium]
MSSDRVNCEIRPQVTAWPWFDAAQAAGDELLEATVQKRLGNRIRDLRVVRSERGIILRGRVPTYYAKQLAQHAILELGELVAANQIEVQ